MENHLANTTNFPTLTQQISTEPNDNNNMDTSYIQKNNNNKLNRPRPTSSSSTEYAESVIDQQPIQGVNQYVPDQPSPKKRKRNLLNL